MKKLSDVLIKIGHIGIYIPVLSLVFKGILIIGFIAYGLVVIGSIIRLFYWKKNTKGENYGAVFIIIVTLVFLAYCAIVGIDK